MVSSFSCRTNTAISTRRTSHIKASSLSPSLPARSSWNSHTLRGRRLFPLSSSTRQDGEHIETKDTQSNHHHHQRTSEEDNKRQLLEANSKLQLAPMMEYTDRHFRHVIRLLSNRTLLYTEMVSASSLSYERQDQMLHYQQRHPTASSQQMRQYYDDQYLQRYLCQGKISPLEGPSVLQIGGNSISQLYQAGETIWDMTSRGHCDYTALNLNCGCPSPKVAGKGSFGAALMDEDPILVRELTQALFEGCHGTLPVSVKCRIGTDTHRPFTSKSRSYDTHQLQEAEEEAEYERLCHFIDTVASNGIVSDFAIHARIAVLTKSFSPAENRKIPPLKYDVVHRLVKDFPHLSFTLNGGIDTLTQAQEQLSLMNPTLNHDVDGDILKHGLRGVMIGRAFAADPWSFSMADHILYHDDHDTMPTKNRYQILQENGRHADYEETLWDPVKIRRFITKAVMTLFTGEPNSRKYRIALDEIANLPKQWHAQGKTTQQQQQPPLSQLLLNAAEQHLSEDVLLRTPQESYERQLGIQLQQQKEQQEMERGDSNKDNRILFIPSVLTSASSSSTAVQRSTAVMEWQLDRHEESNCGTEDCKGQDRCR